MKDKDPRGEKLFERLSETDETLLDEAYKIDSAEKLKVYTKKEGSQKKSAFFLTPTFRRSAVAAVCIILIAAMVFAIPALVAPENKPEGTASGDIQGIIPPWHEGDTDFQTIRSIDMLNYYSAVKILSERSEAALSAEQSGVNIAFLAANGEEEPGFGVGYDDIEYDTPEADNKDDATDMPPSGDGDIIYYELKDFGELFTVTEVYFFRIELTNETGFLASKVGTGIVDVVITENSLEPMITFKNGNRYYSCLINGGSWDGERHIMGFSTHKYIEGFCLVKNLEQNNYAIDVAFENDQAVKIKCTPGKNGGSYPDGDINLVSATEVSYVSASFTIAELEEYFTSGKLPEESEDSSEASVTDSGEAAADEPKKENETCE